MSISTNLFLLSILLTTICAYPQSIPTEPVEPKLEEESSGEKLAVPEIYNTPADVEVNFRANSGPILPEKLLSAQKEDLTRTDRAAAFYSYYYPRVYYYPSKFIWNPYYYYYYWWL